MRGLTPPRPRVPMAPFGSSRRRANAVDDLLIGIAGMVVAMMVMIIVAVALDAANRRWPQAMPPLIVLSVMVFFAVTLAL